MTQPSSIRYTTRNAPGSGVGTTTFAPTIVLSMAVLLGSACSGSSNAPGTPGTGGAVSAPGTGGSGSGGSSTGGSGTPGGSKGGAGAGDSGTGGATGATGGATSVGTGGAANPGGGRGGSGAGGRVGAGGRAGTGGATGEGGAAVVNGRAAPSADPATFGLAGPSKCAGGGFTICEDFEATAVGAVPAGWTKEGTWAAVASDVDKARGTHALQIQVGAANNQRGFLLKTKAQLGDLATKHYGRIFFKLQDPPTRFIHWDFFHGVGPFGAGVSNDVRWGFTGTGTFTYLYNVQHMPGGELGNNAPDRLVIDTWTCAEWLLDSTVAGGGESRLWINGTELPAMHRTGAQAQIPVFDRFGIGWELFNATDHGSVAYIDEVVFDAARIGCNN